MTHPNTLVGIATARIAFNEIPDTPRINTEMESAATGADSRFILLLDALASLSISSLKGQVVAIAAQQDTATLKFTMSENKDVKTGLPEYIKKLLTMLHDLSTSTPAARRGKEREFIKTTYVYSFTKLNKRFSNRKWLPLFEREFEKKSGVNEEKCVNVISSLMTVRRALGLMKVLHDKQDKNPARALTDAEWDTLIFEMAAGVPDVETLLKDRTLSDKWAESLKGVVSVDSKPPGQKVAVPLFRAIEKLTSHHRHILHLFSYAYSADGRADLARTITVVGKPKETTIPKVEFPKISEIEGIIRPILPQGISLDHEIDAIKAGVELNFNLDLKESGPVSFDGTVHCECSLVTMFNLQPHPAPPPIKYIGVSKLSCAACYAWMHAFNTTYTEKYQTRGSHGRWYPKWAMPTAPQVQTPGMLQAMNGIVGKAYRAYYDAGTKARAIVLSDSTEAKGRFPGIVWSDGDLKRRVQLTKSERDARRALPLPPS